MSDQTYTNYWNNQPLKLAQGCPPIPDNAEVVAITRERAVFYCLFYSPPHPEHGHWALWKAVPGKEPVIVPFAEAHRAARGQAVD